MKPQRTGQPNPEPQRESVTALQASDFQRAQELRRVLGDPRVRVQVPTEGDGENPPPTPASQRYHTG